MKLVNPNDVYEVRYPEKGVEESKQPAFGLKLLNSSEAGMIEDSLSITEKKGDRIVHQFLAGTGAKLKIKYAVVNWRNITDDKGAEVPCNDGTKELLPADVRRWLLEKIDVDNGFAGVKEEERKN